MVASSKLHHAQVQIEKMLPYESMLEHIVKTFLASDAEAGTIYELEREVKKVVLVVFASNSSLCGGFNSNIIKLMQQAIAGYEHLGRENILIYPIGRKVAEKVTKLGYRSAGDFSALADKPNSAECIRIATELGAMFRTGEVDKVELIYHHFKSAGSQILTRKTLLPIDVESIVEEDHERSRLWKRIMNVTSLPISSRRRRKTISRNTTRKRNPNKLRPNRSTTTSS